MTMFLYDLDKKGTKYSAGYFGCLAKALVALADMGKAAWGEMSTVHPPI